MKRDGVYIIEYGYNNRRWIIHVHATSPDDAKRRLAAASAFGDVLNPSGEIYRVPAPIGFWVPAWVWLMNKFRS